MRRRFTKLLSLSVRKPENYALAPRKNEFGKPKRHRTDYISPNLSHTHML